MDWHGTNICEVHANFILATGHVVLLDYPADKDREIILHKHEHQYLARHVWRCSRKIQFSFPNSSCFKLLPFYCVSGFFTYRACVCVCVCVFLVFWCVFDLVGLSGLLISHLCLGSRKWFSVSNNTKIENFAFLSHLTPRKF